MPAPLRAGEAYEINGLMARLYAEKWGADARKTEIVPDDEGQIREAIQANLDADMIIIIGGTSVGEKDYAPRVLIRYGRAVRPWCAPSAGQAHRHRSRGRQARGLSARLSGSCALGSLSVCQAGLEEDGSPEGRSAQESRQRSPGRCHRNPAISAWSGWRSRMARPSPL